MDASKKTQTPPVLEIDQVTKSFGPIRALRGVSFDVNRGEVVGLVGDNGAGKSTLVKLVAGVYPPSTGEIRLEGKPIDFSSPADARNLGIETVYQDLALCNNLDVPANLFLGRELIAGGLGRFFGVLRSRKMKELSLTAIRDLHIIIPGFADSVIGEMSGGQRQAVAIARASYWQSKLLLLDEPTAALGVKESAEVRRIIQDTAEQGLPMILISHNMEEVWDLCNVIVVLRQGHHVATLAKMETTPEEIVGHITGAISASKQRAE